MAKPRVKTTELTGKLLKYFLNLLSKGEGETDDYQAAPSATELQPAGPQSLKGDDYE
jgi:hypothetical protein